MTFLKSLREEPSAWNSTAFSNEGKIKRSQMKKNPEKLFQQI
jgi:hypothetical protein